MNLAFKPWRILSYLFLVVMAVYFLIPLYVMVITSFKPAAEATLDNIWTWPSRIDFSAVQEAYSKLAPNFMNSVQMVVPATILSSLLGSFNGYILDKWRFRGSDALFTVILFGMFIPFQSILIPLVLTLQKLGLYNSVFGLILVHVIYGIPVTTLIFRNFYANVPSEMLEAGKTDGCGLFGIYRHLILPLSIPGFVVVGIWQFTQIWNEFLMAVTIMGTSNQPIMVALKNLSGSQITHWNLQMAGSLMAALPTMLIYIFLSRYFIRGLMAGSVKG
jgi:glucose/mannose transport system permease protein